MFLSRRTSLENIVRLEEDVLLKEELASVLRVAFVASPSRPGAFAVFLNSLAI